MVHDHRCQLHQHVRQNICRNNIVPGVSCFFLYRLIINDIPDHHFILITVDSIDLHILIGGIYRTGIQIRTHGIGCPELQRQHTQDTAPAAHIQNLCLRSHIFAQLTDAKLRGLMHARAKCSTRIDVDHKFVAVFRLNILPGWNDQDIIHIELMEILLPVVHPVDVLCLGLLYDAFSHIHIGRHLLQFSSDIAENLFFIRFHFQIKVQVCHSVICFPLGENIYKHLLFVRLRQRNLIHDLHSLDSQVHQHAADNIFRLCCRL